MAFYDNRDARRWSPLEEGHPDTGWAVRVGDDGEPSVMDVKVGEKVRIAAGGLQTGNAYNLFT